jgi:hypothetical protein
MRDTNSIDKHIYEGDTQILAAAHAVPDMRCT